MRCRPSEVRDEDETDIQLWALWDRIEVMVRRREQDRARLEAMRHGHRERVS